MEKKNFLLTFFCACFIVLCFLCVCTFVQTVHAVSIINSPGYIFNSHQFYENEKAQGQVCFKNGFTVTGTHSIVLDITGPVFGAMELNETGTIQLRSDLVLGSTASIPSGGCIDAQGNSLVLTGSLVISPYKTLHITSDGIIDGQGNTLYFDEHAQIVVDAGVTLTLRNMHVKNKRNSFDRPIIVPVNGSSKLSLQNVDLNLQDNLVFKSGKLFIHDDVVVTGTSRFIYSSSQPCYIDQSSRWLFDHGSTFYFAPSTDDNRLIKMFDRSSSMMFDGSTLLTTDTGLRLTKGTLCLDNKVVINSAGTTLSNGIIFGDSSKVGHDLDVKILGGAYVGIYGMVYDDSE